MLDATKVKPQRVAVLEVLRPKGVLVLVKYSAKMRGLFYFTYVEPLKNALV